MTESTILSALVQPDTSESNVKVGSIDEGFILTQYRFLLNVRAFMLQNFSHVYTYVIGRPKRVCVITVSEWRHLY